jgi:hypothetical protein
MGTQFTFPIRCIQLAFALAVFTFPLLSQTPENTVDCKTAEKLDRPNNTFPVSLGVLNAKALELVKPMFPAVAQKVGARGTVQISILIDPRGCVYEAKVVSGHPLLVSESLRAAERSTFSPTTLSDKPVWVYGTIVYNYRSDVLNWLELGFASSSPERLIEYLPSGFEKQRDELRRISRLPDNDRIKEIEAILDTVQDDLTADAKNQWLFDVGRKLNSISAYRWAGRGELNAILRQINVLIATHPPTASPHLIESLRKLTGETDPFAFWKQMKYIEERMFGIGN